MNENATVMVVDHYRQYVGKVTPAVARRALKERRVRVWKKDPFIIQLPPGETSLPSFNAERTHMNPSTTNLNDRRGGYIANWLQFFSVERDIWIQNLTATQLSMSFEIAQGVQEGFLVLPGLNPVCITQSIPFEAIKRSSEFRRFANAQPSVMRVMTQEQALEYYEQQARMSGAFVPDENGQLVPNVTAALQSAEEERKLMQARPATGHEANTTVDAQGQVSFSAPKTALELMGMSQPHMGIAQQAAMAAGLLPNQAADALTNPAAQLGFSNIGAGALRTNPAAGAQSPDPGMGQPSISPAIMQLCHEASLPGNDKLPADEFIRRAKILIPTASDEEVMHMRATVRYPTVQKWLGHVQEQRLEAAETNA